MSISALPLRAAASKIGSPICGRNIYQISDLGFQIYWGLEDCRRLVARLCEPLGECRRLTGLQRDAGGDALVGQLQRSGGLRHWMRGEELLDLGTLVR